MNVKTLCNRMERYYLGHGSPPPHPTPPHTPPVLNSVQPYAVNIKMILTSVDAKALGNHIEGIMLAITLFSHMLYIQTRSDLSECKSPLQPHEALLSWPSLYSAICCKYKHILSLKTLCIHMERYYLGHGSPPPPTPRSSCPPPHCNHRPAWFLNTA